jgi:hypothetical protein
MFKAFKSNNIYDSIYLGYESDKDLVSKWHVIAPASLKECVDKTVLDLKNDTFEDFEFFVVKEDEEFIGYFGKEFGGKYLTTIFIKPEYRERKSEFWKLILNNMANEFKSAIYSKNTPCIKFYNKMGSVEKIIDVHGLQATLFEFRKGNEV